MRVHLVNPSDLSFGTAVITPRWLYVLAAATPDRFGTPLIVDETLEPFNADNVEPGDVVGIGIHTANALRGYAVARLARSRGAFVVFGGIHSTLFPDEVREHGVAHSVVTGDGDLVWPRVLADCEAGTPAASYEGGRIEGESFSAARWDLLPDQPLYVGLNPDRPRLSQTLLVLFGLANRRTKTAAASSRRGGE